MNLRPSDPQSDTLGFRCGFPSHRRVDALDRTRKIDLRDLTVVLHDGRYAPVPGQCIGGLEADALFAESFMQLRRGSGRARSLRAHDAVPARAQIRLREPTSHGLTYGLTKEKTAYEHCRKPLSFLVGVIRFELTASCSQSTRAAEH